MEVRFKTRPDKRFHLPPDVAEVLILWPGSPIEVVPLPPAPRVPQTRWSIERLASTGEPYVYASCASCRQVHQVLGLNTVEQKFQHCGVAEPPPAEILKEYTRLVKKNQPQPRQVLRTGIL